MGASLVVYDLVGGFDLLVKRFHIGALDVFAFIHPVDDHALPSSCKHTLTQSK